MTPPTLPPEAVEQGYDAARRAMALTSANEHQSLMRCTCRGCFDAALPHLRRAILAEVVPRIVEMAREVMPAIDDRGGRSPHYQVPRHTPASILDQLTREGA